MLHYRKSGLVALTILAILVATVMAQLKSNENSRPQQNRGQIDEEQWPLTDFETPLPADPVKRAKRLKRNKKFDKPKVVVEANADYNQSITNDHWYLSIPALPTAQSNLIVIGHTTGSQAYLSDNKNGIYSEFEFQVERVLKDGNQAIAIGNTIDIVREGGRVKQSSGHITRYSINGQNMPRVGNRYLLFLTCADPEQAFDIITGYELRAGKVFPLDKAGDKFDLYYGVDEIDFFNTVQAAILNPQMISQ
ncbi:MAG TPA: hypothetical protein VF553_03425 [Pyrinomonadaceae bacterium]|jgi:hypothetical protein